MNKIFLIIQREYLSRVKKKSFLIMTMVGPLLMASLMIVPVWLAMNSIDAQKILVVDDSYLFADSIPGTKEIQFDYQPNIKLDEAQKVLYNSDYSAILYIPLNILSGGGNPMLYYKKQPGIATERHIETSIEKMMFDFKLMKDSVDRDMLHKAKSNITLITKKQTETGETEETNSSLNMVIGFGAGVLIYMFIFLYGVQVMRGVMEEKTNRIVEVILSSVKPFELMMGKIVGVAMVGLTQFILWTVLTFGLYSVAQATILKDVSKQFVEQKELKEEILKQGTNIGGMAIEKNNKMQNKAFRLIEGIERIDIVSILICFVIYFLGGYLLYSALFAAIGAAVDNETDTQQFMLPITIPLIFSFVIAESVIQNPEGSLSFWASIIPLTSPVVMMVRLPFGVPPWQIYLSIGLLIVGFIFTTWLAARIYRVGILMYGKKVSYKELAKWLFYKG